MGKLQQFADEIKEIVSSADGTTTIKLIAVLEAAGITGTAEIAGLVGLKVRAVQSARAASRNAPQCAHHNALSHASAAECANNAPQCVDQTTESASECANAHHNAPPPRAPVVIPARATLESLRDELLPKRVTPSSVPPTPIAEPKPLRSRGSRLSADWTLPDDWKAWARTTFPATSDQIVTDEADKFRDYWTAKAGQGGSKLDWQATWRNWCRTAFAAIPRRDRQPINHGRSAYDEKRAGQLEDWRDERRRKADECARILKIGKYRETPLETVQ